MDRPKCDTIDARRQGQVQSRRVPGQGGHSFVGEVAVQPAMAFIHWPDGPRARMLTAKMGSRPDPRLPALWPSTVPPFAPGFGAPAPHSALVCAPIPMFDVQGVSSVHSTEYVHTVWTWAPSTADTADFGVPSLGRQSFNNHGMAEARRFSMGIKPHFAAGQRPRSYSIVLFAALVDLNGPTTTPLDHVSYLLVPGVVALLPLPGDEATTQLSRMQALKASLR